MPLPSDLSFSDSLKSEPRRAFYEQHKVLAVIMILVVFLLPFAGLLVNGLFGAVLGTLVSFAFYYLTPYVARKLVA
jgi:hypothetical protein